MVTRVCLLLHRLEVNSRSLQRSWRPPATSGIVCSPLSNLHASLQCIRVLATRAQCDILRLGCNPYLKNAAKLRSSPPFAPYGGLKLPYNYRWSPYVWLEACGVVPRATSRPSTAPIRSRRASAVTAGHGAKKGAEHQHSSTAGGLTMGRSGLDRDAGPYRCMPRDQVVPRVTSRPSTAPIRSSRGVQNRSQNSVCPHCVPPQHAGSAVAVFGRRAFEAASDRRAVASLRNQQGIYTCLFVPSRTTYSTLWFDTCSCFWYE